MPEPGGSDPNLGEASTSASRARHVIAGVDELDPIAADLEVRRANVVDDRDLRRVAVAALPPAHDAATQPQADVSLLSLRRAYRHKRPVSDLRRRPTRQAPGRPSRLRERRRGGPRARRQACRTMTVLFATTLSAVSIALTGCTENEAAPAIPVPDAPATSTTETAPTAPTVSDPLDASKYVADPCAVLTPAQLASYGLDRTGLSNTPVTSSAFEFPSCLWYGNAQTFNVGVSWLTSNTNGLADLYDLQNRFKDWDYFEPIEVEDYPAVFNYFSDDPRHGNCHLAVGISDRLVYTVYLQGQGNIDAELSCDLVVHIAKYIIKLLKENP